MMSSSCGKKLSLSLAHVFPFTKRNFCELGNSTDIHHLFQQALPKLSPESQSQGLRWLGEGKLNQVKNLIESNQEDAPAPVDATVLAFQRLRVAWLKELSEHSKSD